MRKLFSLLTAVLFAGSMFATVVTITPDKLTAAESVEISQTVDGVTLAISQGTITAEQIRIFKNQTITISAESAITKIVFTCTANNDTKYGPGCFGAVDGYSFEDKVGTWQGSAKSIAFTATSNQVRATSIVVTLGEGGDEPGDEPGDDPQPVTDPTNCAEAAAAALSVTANNALYNDGKVYTIQGFVTEIAYAWKDGSTSFWMADTKDGGRVLEAYKCECTEENAPAVGDKVAVTGKLTKYNTTPEFAAGCTVEIIEKAAVEPAQNIEITINSLTAPGSLIWTDFVDVEGWWQIIGFSESYEFSLSNISTTETAGVYTVDDLDSDYSYISIYGAKDTVDVAFADGSVTVALSNDGIVTIKGTLVGADGNNYIFNLTYKAPVAEATVDVPIEGKLFDQNASQGLYTVYGRTADESIYVQLTIWAEEGFAGEFTEYDLDTYYIGSGIAINDKPQEIFTAEIEVIPGEKEGDYTVNADLLCYNNTLYKVVMTIAGDPEEGIEDVLDAKKVVKSIKDGMFVIEKGGIRYNANGTVIR